MKRPIVTGVVVLAGLVALAAPARAQLSFSFQVHGGFTMGTGDFGDVAENGVSLGAEAIVGITEYLGVYAGYSADDFPCDDTGSATLQCDPTAEFESSGFSAGARGTLPLESAVRPWASLGVLLHDLELAPFDSDGDTGFEVGLGVEFNVSDVISLGPQVRYRAYTVADTENDVSYFTFEVGGRIRFGSSGG